LGVPVAIAPLFLYSEDTSGNRTKKWHKFDVWFMSLAFPLTKKAHDTTDIFLLPILIVLLLYQFLSHILMILSLLRKVVQILTLYGKKKYLYCSCNLPFM
uniref:Uncharacterized protein n=1 Tax=Amphimedon queenslandica TaxID=400682 RepID=A0A1X7U6A3_AMPQE